MYEVRYQKHAARHLLRMPRVVARRIRAGIEAVAANPYGKHPNATRLSGRDGGFRLRAGDWRVVYALDDERKQVLVANIDRRGRVYR
jgi:mRNA interferase RelE/StbE